jgi:hypothetical protein
LYRLEDVKDFGLDGKPPRIWFLLMERGHFRVLPEVQILADSHLKEMWSRVTGEASDDIVDVTSAEPARSTARVVRLLPVLVPRDKSWRFSLPGFFWALKPPDASARDFTTFQTIDGFLELWYTDVLRRSTDQLISWS